MASAPAPEDKSTPLRAQAVPRDAVAAAAKAPRAPKPSDSWEGQLLALGDNIEHKLAMAAYHFRTELASTKRRNPMGAQQSERLSAVEESQIAHGVLGQAEETLVAWRSRLEVVMDQLEKNCSGMRADLDALSARVDTAVQRQSDSCGLEQRVREAVQHAETRLEGVIERERQAHARELSRLADALDEFDGQVLTDRTCSAAASHQGASLVRRLQEVLRGLLEDHAASRAGDRGARQPGAPAALHPTMPSRNDARSPSTPGASTSTTPGSQPSAPPLYQPRRASSRQPEVGAAQGAAQVRVVVPLGARPGETQIQVRVEDPPAELWVTVPPEAKVGDTITLTRAGDGPSWQMAVTRGRHGESAGALAPQVRGGTPGSGPAGGRQRESMGRGPSPDIAAPPAAASPPAGGGARPHQESGIAMRGMSARGRTTRAESKEELLGNHIALAAQAAARAAQTLRGPCPGPS